MTELHQETAYWLRVKRSKLYHIVVALPKGNPARMSRCGSTKVREGEEWLANGGEGYCRKCEEFIKRDNLKVEEVKAARMPLPVPTRKQQELKKVSDSQWMGRKNAEKVHLVAEGEIASICGLARSTEDDKWVLTFADDSLKCAKCEEKYAAVTGKPRRSPKPYVKPPISKGATMVTFKDLQIVVKYLKSLRDDNPNEGYIENNIRESIILGLEKYIARSKP